MKVLALLVAASAALASATPNDDQCLELLYGGVRKVVSGAMTMMKMDVNPDGVPCGLVVLALRTMVQDFNDAGCSRGYAGGNEVFEARALSLIRDFVENPEDCPALDNGVPESEYMNPPEVVCTPEDEVFSIAVGAISCSKEIEETINKDPPPPGMPTASFFCPLIEQGSSCMENALEMCYADPDGAAAYGIKQEAVAELAGYLVIIKEQYRQYSEMGYSPGPDPVDMILSCPKTGLVGELAKLDFDTPLEPVDESVISDALDTPLLRPNVMKLMSMAEKLEEFM